LGFSSPKTPLKNNARGGLTKRLVVWYKQGMDSTEVKKLRKSLGLTQKEMAARLKVDAITVSRWERNEQTPSSVAQRQLARLVNKITNEKATEKLSG